MGGMGIGRIDTRVGLSLLEGPSVKNKRSRLNIFLFSSLILFYFWFISLYSIFRN